MKEKKAVTIIERKKPLLSLHSGDPHTEAKF
jgi:hypothetical protein